MEEMQQVRFFLEFLHQPVPKAGKEMPVYYRRALAASEILLVVYFLVCFFFFPIFTDRWHWVPLAMIGGTALGVYALRKMGPRANLLLFTVLCVAWVGWNIRTLGWSTGSQHFLTLLLVLVFFNVHEKPVTKILWFLALLVFRILLFSWQQQHDPLPNRRAMIETIERYQKVNPELSFSVAIADIDFFKKVNDTYGHNCGDYTLVKLTELFKTHSAGQYSVCRWGGEDFCFFIPEKNVDEAGVLMNDLCFAVQRMPLHFEDVDFSITITIGVEECDFLSPLEDLLKKADEKLYMGKEAGRNRVVV